MNLLLLTIQSSVCVLCVLTVKKLGAIKFRDFDMNDAKRWFPISVLLVSVIYTGSKAIVSYRTPRKIMSVDISTAISQHSGVYDFQEPHNYPDCESRSFPLSTLRSKHLL